ncbi:MAG: hypothetical protein LBI18_15745 [Planctomycetaceae bacterium]|nr:hypothetical protein [Planctomycetaceae bacterium]
MHYLEQYCFAVPSDTNVRDGEKYPLVMKLAVFHVLAKTERGKHGRGESEWLIIVEQLRRHATRTCPG